MGTLNFDELPGLSEILKDHPGWLDEVAAPSEAAEITDTPEDTLSTLRCRGGGPPYVKKLGKIGYIRRDLFMWLRSNRRLTTKVAA